MRSRDQVLFLRGFKLDFSQKFRTQEKSKPTSPTNHQGPDNEDKSPRSPPPDKKDSHDPHGKRGGMGGKNGQNHSMGRSGSQGGGSCDAADEGATITSFPDDLAQDTCHPCDAINKFLLAETGSDVALSHDDDWHHISDLRLQEISTGSQNTTEFQSIGEVSEPQSCGITIRHGVASLYFDKTTTARPTPLPLEASEKPKGLTTDSGSAVANPSGGASGGRVAPSQSAKKASSLPLLHRSDTSITDSRHVPQRRPRPPARDYRVAMRTSTPSLNSSNGDLFPEPLTRDSGVIILLNLLPIRCTRLMGQTGAGKSHFINSVARRNVAPVGRGLSIRDVQSFTIDNPYPILGSGRSAKARSKIILVDTPGLNNTDQKTCSDLQIIRRIADWLNDNCNDDALFGGIIFMHDITEDRARVYSDALAWPIKYFDSPHVLQHIVLTTSKWDLDLVKENMKRFIDREKDLSEMQTWKRLLIRGASLCRYAGNTDTAWDSIQALLQMNMLQVALARKDFNAVHTCSKLFREVHVPAH
ncbi:hypothetical protein NMY22_g15985 [Coprinellus aureogranulatus]|nr:hypothetical protein NMY22_g15985 [Coprinellus aureogranulatus]